MPAVAVNLFILILPLTDLFGIAVVGHSEIGREAQLHRQIGMLRLVARNAHTAHAAFGDVIQASADAILRIVALCRHALHGLFVKAHHLPHAHMTQRDAHGHDQILGSERIGIPVGDAIRRCGQLVFLSVGKPIRPIGIGYLQFSFGLHADDGRLVVQHATVVFQKPAVLTGEIDQTGREAGTAASSLGPQRTGRAPRIVVAAAAGKTSIHRSQTSLFETVHVGNAPVVVQQVALQEAVVELARNPGRVRVVGRFRVVENRCRTGREFFISGFLSGERVDHFRFGQRIHLAGKQTRRKSNAQETKSGMDSVSCDCQSRMIFFGKNILMFHVFCFTVSLPFRL